MSSIPNAQQLSAVNPAALAAVTRGGGGGVNAVRAQALKSKTDKEMQSERLRAAATSQDKSLRASAIQSANQIAAVDARAANQLAATQADTRARLAQNQAQFQTTTAATLAQNQIENKRQADQDIENKRRQQLLEGQAQEARRVRTEIQALNNKILASSGLEYDQLKQERKALRDRETQLSNEIFTLDTLDKVSTRAETNANERLNRVQEEVTERINNDERLADAVGDVTGQRFADTIAEQILDATRDTGNRTLLGSVATLFTLGEDSDKIANQEKAVLGLLEDAGVPPEQIANYRSFPEKLREDILTNGSGLRDIVTKSMAQGALVDSLTEGLMRATDRGGNIDEGKFRAAAAAAMSEIFEGEGDVSKSIQKMGQDLGINGTLMTHIFVNLGDTLEQAGGVLSTGIEEEGLVQEGRTNLFGMSGGDTFRGTIYSALLPSGAGAPTTSAMMDLFGDSMKDLGRRITTKTFNARDQIEQTRELVDAIDFARDVLSGDDRFDELDNEDDYTLEELNDLFETMAGYEEGESRNIKRLASMFERSAGNLQDLRQAEEDFIASQGNITQDQLDDIQDMNRAELIALQRQRLGKREVGTASERQRLADELEEFRSSDPRSFLDPSDLAALEQLVGADYGAFDVGGLVNPRSIGSRNP